MKENSLLNAIPLLHKYYEEKNLFFSCTVTIIGLLFSWCFGIGILFIAIFSPFLFKKAVLQIALEYGFDENDINYYQLEEYVFSEIKDNNENEIKNNLDKTGKF